MTPKLNLETFDTQTLLSLMAKLQQIKAAAKDASFQHGSDPRYGAISLKIDDLLTRLKKLIAPVMLAEIAYIQKLTKELYEWHSEKEENVVTKGNNDRGN